MESVLIAVVAIIGVFFIPVVAVILIIWIIFNARRKRYQLQADLYAKAIEKGQPVPADLFAAELPKKRNPLNTGIICIAVGIGIALFIWLSKGAVPGGVQVQHVGAASLGIIPFLIGVAYVIIHFIEKGKATEEDAK